MVTKTHPDVYGKIVGDSPEHQVEKDAEAAQGRGLEEAGATSKA